MENENEKLGSGGIVFSNPIPEDSETPTEEDVPAEDEAYADTDEEGADGAESDDPAEENVEDDAEDESDPDEENEESEDEEAAAEEDTDGDGDAEDGETEVEVESAPAAAPQNNEALNELLADLGYESMDAYRAQKAGKTLEEYTQEQEDKRVLEEARRIVQRDKAAKMIAADIKSINAAHGLNLSSMKDMKNPQKFVEYRTKNGLSAEDAFLLSNKEMITERATAASARKAAGKSHLTTVAGKTKSGGGADVPEEIVAFMRRDNPNMSRKEIAALYKRVGGTR
jgi:hypothetical protein